MPSDRTRAAAASSPAPRTGGVYPSGGFNFGANARAAATAPGPGLPFPPGALDAAADPKGKSGGRKPRAPKIPAAPKAPATAQPKAPPAPELPPATPMDTPIQFVKGIGPRLGQIFKSREIHTVRDLLYFFPRAYEDRTKLQTLSELKEGQLVTVSVRVLGKRSIPLRGRYGQNMLEVRVTDDTGTLMLKWFRAPRGMEARFTPGAQLLATGAIKSYMGRLEMAHPEITWGMQGAVPNGAGSAPEEPGDDSGTPDVGRIVPIYTEIEGVSSRVLRKVLWEALQKYGNTVSEDLPPPLLAKHGLPSLADAIRQIHFPDDQIPNLTEFNTPSHWRLIFEEFFKFEYLVLRQRLRLQKEMAPRFESVDGLAALEDLRAMLPFQLTGGQQAALDDILKDFAAANPGRAESGGVPSATESGGVPMNRLIQGDVGSGKTAVALLSAGAVLAQGGQAALMAPTEILAEQHFKNAQKLFKGRLNVALLVGKTPMSERRQLFPRLASGEPILLIGTHALIEDAVVFANLNYIMIDEQQRFGVDQRRTLRRKGMRMDEKTGRPIFPHTLVLTATPIPRTLSLTIYGDLAVSTIKELPPGRSPIVTKIVKDAANMFKAHELIKSELAKGRQAYFIYPLVNESEAEGFTQLKSAIFEAERLQHEVFPEYKVGLLHGQLSPDEKADIMGRFSRNELQVLVSTTVVEVGVDVPTATIMVVEHAERFGLSQLHQLRGRVGRGAHQSYCFLFSKPKANETTSARLDVLEESTDGFRIAEADLEIRGPGEFLGTRQAGGLPFRLANLVRDKEWLLKARNDAEELLRDDADLRAPEHLPLRKYFEREGKLQTDRLKTS